MKIENYSVYTNEPYASNFRKLYKGVIVVVDPDYRGINPYMHFAIRKKKAKETIFKTRTEKMYKLIFKDTEKSRLIGHFGCFLGVFFGIFQIA